MQDEEKDSDKPLVSKIQNSGEDEFGRNPRKYNNYTPKRNEKKNDEDGDDEDDKNDDSSNSPKKKVHRTFYINHEVYKISHYQCNERYRKQRLIENVNFV